MKLQLGSRRSLSSLRTWSNTWCEVWCVNPFGANFDVRISCLPDPERESAQSGDPYTARANRTAIPTTHLCVVPRLPRLEPRPQRVPQRAVPLLQPHHHRLRAAAAHPAAAAPPERARQETAAAAAAAAAAGGGGDAQRRRAAGGGGQVELPQGDVQAHHPLAALGGKVIPQPLEDFPVVGGRERARVVGWWGSCMGTQLLLVGRSASADLDLLSALPPLPPSCDPPPLNAPPPHLAPLSWMSSSNGRMYSISHSLLTLAPPQSRSISVVAFLMAAFVVDLYSVRSAVETFFSGRVGGWVVG